MSYLVNKSKAEAGFTLVELSIVIVIIGFLVAGIAAGANMVKQAQIRSVITDMQSYQTSYNGFVGRYNKAPGDLEVASTYWPGAANCSVSGTATGDNNCNGNGDGTIDASATAASDEVAAALKHLQLAGFIGAGIAAVPDAIAALTPGSNAPSSKITGAGFTMAGTTALTRGAGAASIGFGAGSTNYLYLGKNPGTTVTNNLTAGAVAPEDAFNIDAKLDDGIVSGTNFQGFNSGNFRAALGTDNTANSCINVGVTSYVITTTETACLVGMAIN
jgi:prepilin-type N-terminal cleavage/methylation domain-containing protein